MSELKKNVDKMPDWLKYTLYTILGIAGAFLLGLLFGNVIMWLWNWLMPSLFGLRTIGFWEGLGLFLLAKILFGFGGSGHSGDDGSKHHKKHRHHGARSESRDWKDWEYYDDWWEENGKSAFHSYAEQKRKKPNDGEAPKADAE
jgi:hypothetical protein